MSKARQKKWTLREIIDWEYNKYQEYEKKKVKVNTMIIKSITRYIKYQLSEAYESDIDYLYEYYICYYISKNIDTYIYSSLINLSSKLGFNKKISEIYQEMIENKIQPDCITYNTLMKAYDNQGKYKEVEQIYQEIKEQNLLKVKEVSSIEIDIHGLQSITLQYYLEDIKNEIIDSRFKIICGRGNNSGEEGPILNKVIIDFCKKYKLKYKIDSNGGRFIIG